MSVSLAYSSTTVTLQNPDLGDKAQSLKHQALARRADGSYARYAFASGQALEREMGWSALRRSEWEALKSFFETTVDGVLTAFTFTDERGTAWTAHFLDPELEAETVADGVSSSGTFTSGAVSYPTTTRNGGEYAVSVRLALTAIAATTTAPATTTEGA
jgi:hypothetical protein